MTKQIAIIFSWVSFSLALVSTSAFLSMTYFEGLSTSGVLALPVTIAWLVFAFMYKTFLRKPKDPGDIT